MAELRSHTKHKVADHILSVVWLLLLFTPVGALFYVLVPLSFVLLYNYGKATTTAADRWARWLIVSIFLSLLFNLSESYISSDKIVLRDVTLAIILFASRNLRGGTILKPYIWFALIYVFLSQVTFVYDIPYLTSLYDRLYHITSFYYEQLSIDSRNYDVVDAGVSLRLGGLYYNSNNCASFISLILALALCESRQFRRSEIALFCVLAFVAIMFTGSRTSILVYAAILLLYLYNTGNKRLLVVVLGVAMVLAAVSLEVLQEFRMFKINEGMSNSFGVKMAIIGNYLRQVGFVDFVFGAGGTEALVYNYHQSFVGTDCDLGDLLVSYGVLFYIFYVGFYIAVGRRLRREYLVVLLVLVWMFSNTIMFSYRMSAVWMMTLGVLYKKSISEDAVAEGAK